jgi:hypothetical protein
MDSVKKFAEKHDCQVWIEQVADSASQNGIFIEDGEIVTATKNKAAEQPTLGV